MSETYLVTGGAGFIGSHIVDRLINQGNEVIVVDDLSTGKLDNINKKAYFIKGDLSEFKVLKEITEDIDGVFHLAAVASVEKSTKEWLKSNLINQAATVYLFEEMARKQKVIPIVYASSAAVYGNKNTVPLYERQRTEPITSYGIDKLASELQAKIAWDIHGVPSIGIRPFNVYGPRQDPSSQYSGVISIFIDRILNNKKLTIYGDGNQIRDFVYVADAVAVFTKAMQHLKQNLNQGAGIFNLCTGVATSINQLAEVIANCCRVELKKEYQPTRRGDIRLSRGCTMKLKSDLGFVPNTNLKDGLQYTIESIREKDTV